jgi:AraC family transcriptional regulator, regulatory protein of adaptative response / methylated-DNA-[protein]-cysteine methyltransferase
LAARVFAFDPTQNEAIPLVLRGTNFQIKVWEALLRIPPGRFISYQDLACAVGRPEAPRAVGAAVGRNPISLIIPCHRVILKSGVVHNYRWGVQRKKALLAFEAARAAG